MSACVENTYKVQPPEAGLDLGDPPRSRYPLVVILFPAELEADEVLDGKVVASIYNHSISVAKIYCVTFLNVNFHFPIYIVYFAYIYNQQRVEIPICAPLQHFNSFLF